jgi:hypothetical protein
VRHSTETGQIAGCQGPLPACGWSVWKRRAARTIQSNETMRADVRLLPTAAEKRTSPDVAEGPVAEVGGGHSITSSARASTLGGIVTPNAFAVFRLRTIMYLDACSTGRSAGFSPLKILSI